MNSSWCFAIFFFVLTEIPSGFPPWKPRGFFHGFQKCYLEISTEVYFEISNDIFLYLQKFIHLHFQIHMDFTRNLRRSSPGVFYEFLLAVMSPRFFSGITYEILVAFYDVSSKNSFWCFFFFSQKFPLSFLQGCLQEFFHGFLQKFIQDF